jgi:hypothetical protein
VEGGDYIKTPEVGGIIGHDREHGPEGMVYGTVPYQRRDFLRVYLEWREAVRRSEPSAVRIFTWMVHPYQLIPSYLGTDGRSPRVHIEELVAWLRENFIEHTDESGYVMARFANAAEIRAEFEKWEQDYPPYAAQLQSMLAADRFKPLYFPGIFRRLETTFYDQRMATADSNLVIHRMIDRNTQQFVYLLWSRAGEIPLEPALSGRFRVIRGDGSWQDLNSHAIQIGVQPVLLEPLPATNVKEEKLVPYAFSLQQNYPFIDTKKMLITK